MTSECCFREIPAQTCWSTIFKKERGIKFYDKYDLLVEGKQLPEVWVGKKSNQNLTNSKTGYGALLFFGGPDSNTGGI